MGVSVKTLQRWDREGTLKANRTPTDRRYYTYNQYLQFKGINSENDNRQIVIYARVSTKKWNELLDEVFVRFGYDWFEKFCMKFNTTIVVVNNEALSPQEELVQDIVSILDVFSRRLYGLRKYKKQIKGDEEIAQELQNGNQSDKGTDRQNQ